MRVRVGEPGTPAPVSGISTQIRGRCAVCMCWEKEEERGQVALHILGFHHKHQGVYLLYCGQAESWESLVSFFVNGSFFHHLLSMGDVCGC